MREWKRQWAGRGVGVGARRDGGGYFIHGYFVPDFDLKYLHLTDQMLATYEKDEGTCGSTEYGTTAKSTRGRGTQLNTYFLRTYVPLKTWWGLALQVRPS